MPAKAAPNLQFELRRLEAGDNVSGLSLGNPNFVPLKTFLKRDAKSYEASSLTRTYAFYENGKNKVLAYITILCGEVASQVGDEIVNNEQIHYKYDHFPAIKIARLAVTKDLQGYDLGRQLVNFALGITVQYVCPNVGCRFAVVDSKQESIRFYEKCGFTLIDTKENRTLDTPVMFMDLSRLPA